MTTKRIDEVTAATELTGDDLLPIMDGAATTKRILASVARDYFAAASQPLDSDLTAIAALTTTAYGRALLELANQAALLAAVGALGLAAGGASVEDIGAVEWRVNTVTASGATETLDTSAYGTHDVTMDQSCTLTFANPAPSGKETEFKLILRGAYTPTFPAAVDWASGSAPTYTSPAVYIFSTVDAGTTWLGFQAGKAFA